MKRFVLKKCLLAGAAAVLTPAAALAQADDDDDIEDTIIVTGTKTERTGFDTPSSVATVGQSDLRIFSGGSGSQADVLQNLPGLNAEGGGGEVATNFRVRGLPSGGQFEFTPLQYDGIPVFSTFGLNSSAFDFFARNDLGIERLEFNKGGVANLFGVGGQAGVINYISKTGSDESHGTIQFEYGARGRYRGDFAAQGPLGENTFYAVSGFYRIDEGPIDTGLDTEGFSIRGNVRREFEDGSGHFQLNGSYINDRVQFFLPTVLDGQSRERIAGNDGETVFSLNSSAVAGLTALSPEGVTTFDADNGFRTVGGHIYATLDKEFGDGWGIEAKVKWTSLDSGSNFFNNGNGPNAAAPETFADFAAARGLGDPANLNFTFAETGQVLASTDLVFQNQFNDRERDATDGTIELNITKKIELGSVTHNFTLGGFVARAEADNIQRNVSFLGDFTNNPDLVAVTVDNPLDPANPFQVTTPGGIIQAPSGFANQEREAFRRAIYFADQIQADRWQFDLGVRIESQTARNRFEGTTTLPVTLQGVTNPLAGAALTTQSFGNGQFLEGEATATAWAVAGAASYLLTDNLNVYVNGSRGFFFPQPQGTGGQISATGDIQVYDEEPIIQAAVGLKYRNSVFNGYIEGFYTGLRDRNNVVFTNNSPIPTVFATSSDTFGIEADARFSVTDNIDLTGNIIFQDHEFTEGAFVGNELNRLPNILANLGAQARFAGFDASVFWNYNGDSFQDFGNGVPLDAFSIVRLEAGYTLPVGENNDAARISVGVWNLLNSQGLQEGNPRAGLTQAVGAADEFFVGRPILPRRVSLRFTYDY